MGPPRVTTRMVQFVRSVTKVPSGDRALTAPARTDPRVVLDRGGPWKVAPSEEVAMEEANVLIPEGE